MPLVTCWLWRHRWPYRSDCADGGRRRCCGAGQPWEAILGGLCESMEPFAREAVYWTRKQLRQPERDFIRALPMTESRGNAFYVHASAASPGRWTYIDNAVAAAKCMDASGAPLTFAGHVHHQCLYYTSGHGAAQVFNPVIGAAIPVSTHRRWLAIAGSVGQPRDGIPLQRTCFTISNANP